MANTEVSYLSHRVAQDSQEDNSKGSDLHKLCRHHHSNTDLHHMEYRHHLNHTTNWLIYLLLYNKHWIFTGLRGTSLFKENHLDANYSLKSTHRLKTEG